MKCEMCIYIKIDGKQYPFVSPCVCTKCDNYDVMPDNIKANGLKANLDA